jgi:hypothetical protein
LLLDSEKLIFIGLTPLLVVVLGDHTSRTLPI